MLYLIMNCSEPDEHADRTPLAITEDWEEYYDLHKSDLDLFEVYAWDGQNMEKVKDYDQPVEEGMALYYWTAEEINSSIYYPPSIIKKWVNKGSNDEVPLEILALNSYKYALKHGDVINWLEGWGWMKWYDESGACYIYGKYVGSNYIGGW
mgnify:CR=1 FL=1